VDVRATNKPRIKDSILAINQRAINYWGINLDTSIALAKESIRLANISGIFDEKARSYNIAGVAYYHMGNFETAKLYYDTCLIIGERYNKEEDIYKCLTNIGQLYYTGYLKEVEGFEKLTRRLMPYFIERNDYNLALNYGIAFILLSNIHGHSPARQNNFLRWFSSIPTVRQNENWYAIYSGIQGYYYRSFEWNVMAINRFNTAITLASDSIFRMQIMTQIASVNFNMNYPQPAIYYFNEAIKLDASNRNTCILNAQIGACYLKLNQYKKAYDYIYPALTCNSFNFNDHMVLLNNLGNVYLKMDSLGSAEKYLMMALEELTSIPEYNEMRLGFLHSLAELYIKMEDRVKLDGIISDIEKLTAINSYGYFKSDGANLLADYYHNIGNIDKAIYYLKLAADIEDSIRGVKHSKALAEYHVKFETTRKEQKIVLQNKNIQNKGKIIRLLTFGFITLMVMIIIISILYNRTRAAYQFLIKKSLQSLEVGKPLFMEDRIHKEQNYNISAIDQEQKDNIYARLNNEIEANEIFNRANLSLSELAELCSTNRSYLSQVINEKYNQNFSNLINKKRIEKSIELMASAEDNIPIKALASQVGFNSVTTFYESFKKYTGVTPSYYQRNVKSLFMESAN
jgi:AraC-like DNA-binding protein